MIYIHFTVGAARVTRAPSLPARNSYNSPKKNKCHLVTALLYTTKCGQRLREHGLSSRNLLPLCLDSRVQLHTHQRHQAVLGGADVRVVGVPAPHVRRRVDQPRGVQRAEVPQDAPHVRRPQRLSPEVHRDHGGEGDGHGEGEGKVVAVLEHDHRVGAEVAQVDLGALPDDLGVLADEEPTDLKRGQFLELVVL